MGREVRHSLPVAWTRTSKRRSRSTVCRGSITRTLSPRTCSTRTIKRRTHVVRIFPNEAACLRLARALTQEIREDWILDKDLLTEHKKSQLKVSVPA